MVELLLLREMIIVSVVVFSEIFSGLFLISWRILCIVGLNSLELIMMVK